MNILHHYFDSLTKLFSDLYLSKVLDTLAISLFPCFFLFSGIDYDPYIYTSVIFILFCISPKKNDTSKKYKIVQEKGKRKLRI